MKNFVKKTEGFTLVELIVVIAILGILAGVGTVGYSGYIKKANMAADQQLVAAINQAYAIACVENGVNAAVTDAEDITKDDIDAIDVKETATVSAALAAKIEDSFAKYFAGNESATLKVAETLNFQNGTFVADFAISMITASYGGGQLSFSTTDIGYVNGSTFMQAASLGGASGLLGKVDSVTNFAAALVDDEAGGSGKELLNSVLNSSGFSAYFMSALGDDPEGQTLYIMQEVQKNNPTLDTSGVVNKMNTNAAVLYAANLAKDMNQSDILSMLSGNAKSTIITNMNAGTAEGTSTAFAQATLAYGMYTAFAHSEYGSAEAQGKNAAAALADLNNSDFKAYLNTEQAKTDLQGYMSALNMINSSSKDPKAVSSLLINGFGDSDLAEALDGALKGN